MSEPAPSEKPGSGSEGGRVVDPGHGTERSAGTVEGRNVRRSVGKGPPDRCVERGLRRALGIPLLALVLAIPACGGAEEEATPPVEAIPRETFVSAYVDLRMAALRDTAGISTEERESILGSHGITPADLVRFVEVYGEDPEALQEVWSDVQDRIREAREAATLEGLEGDAPSEPGPAEDPAPDGDGDIPDDDDAPDAGAV